ncbi:FRG domain-containing protein [Methylovulum psychrotolerans]|uniref:FRG domain-containing protein n=1 Tax=Methylovulum psychrotolerans TaxID=1704499 RepID=UPI001BFF84C2|nr:FRG domain-containing protein [Methylovulum psychrotolerans]MBT9096733.1 FRG domain-containing protein [Methylovulum psychrotolerans]
MDNWYELYGNITETIQSFKTDILFFRGHSNASWNLLPTLARIKKANRTKLEQILYFDFQTRAGSLLPENNSCWNNAFTMQHHGLPTRLLDWSENFATALYFALKGAQGECCVWVLNPFSLNAAAIDQETLPRPGDLNGTYDDYFISENRKIEGKVIAISPFRHHPRVFHQRAGFTIHDDLESPLEKLYPDCLAKIMIPEKAQSDARQFLKLVGVTEFTLFPDLDGLSRELIHEHLL